MEKWIKTVLRNYFVGTVYVVVNLVDRFVLIMDVLPNTTQAFWYLPCNLQPLVRYVTDVGFPQLE